MSRNKTLNHVTKFTKNIMSNNNGVL